MGAMFQSSVHVGAAQQPAASQPSTGAGNEDDEQPSCSTSSSTLPEYKRRLRGGARCLNVDYCGQFSRLCPSSILSARESSNRLCSVSLLVLFSFVFVPGSLRKTSVSSLHPRLPSPSPSPPPNHHVDPPPSYLSLDTPSLPPRPSSTPT